MPLTSGRGDGDSRPVIRSRTSAAPATSLASGPTASRLQASGTTPSAGTRPRVGRMPTTPQRAAGTRIEPLVSVPIAASARPPATAAAGPELEPPVSRVGSQGLRQSPLCGLRPSMPQANSLVLPLPMTIAPAARSRATTVASRSGWRTHSAPPAVVGIPATSTMSLTQIGIPASGEPRVGRSAAGDLDRFDLGGLRPCSFEVEVEVGVQGRVEPLGRLDRRLDPLLDRAHRSAPVLRSLDRRHAIDLGRRHRRGERLELRQLGGHLRVGAKLVRVAHRRKASHRRVEALRCPRRSINPGPPSSSSRGC